MSQNIQQQEQSQNELNDTVSKSTSDLSDEQSQLVKNTTLDTKTAAIKYALAGASVIPLVLPTKNPTISWTPLQTTIATSDEITAWFQSEDVQVGIICGEVSGHLEIIDFDEKYNLATEALFDRFKCAIGEIAPGLIEKLVIEKTISNGYHIAYRSSTTGRNQKLAHRLATPEENKIETAYSKTFIETRGEGGYFMCAPSRGYELIQGSLDNIPTITEDERNLLLNCARSYNEVIEATDVINPPSYLNVLVDRPGDDFNRRGDIRENLRDHNWTLVRKDKEREYWRRPGKTFGVSACLNFAKRDQNAFFYVFSTNAAPLEAEKYHSLFSVYTKLAHAGDWKKAAGILAKMGYGATTISEAEEYLAKRYEFRLNLITGRTEYKEIGASEFTDLDENRLNSLFRELQKYHIKVSIDTLARLLHSDFIPSYDPFVEYYNALPKWDGTRDYIGELANTVILPDSDSTEAEIFKEHLKKWLVNAVACAIEPKITNQNALILVGAQGRYKTTWLNRLVPPELARYKFVGTINPDNKDALIAISECFLINLDELETLTKADIGSLKSIMTMDHIHVRRPYARLAEDLIRRASFVGSINRAEFLGDETGTRRFLTFEIETIDLGKTVDMNMVHAQAYELFKSGYRYWFDKADIDAVNTQNEKFAIRTTEDELLQKLSVPAKEDEIKDGKCEWKSATDLATEANTYYKYPMTTNSARNFGIALTKAKYTSKKTARGKTYATISHIGALLNRGVQVSSEGQRTADGVVGLPPSSNLTNK